jgi:hypothetical protein
MVQPTVLIRARPARGCVFSQRVFRRIADPSVLVEMERLGVSFSRECSVTLAPSTPAGLPEKHHFLVFPEQERKCEPPVGCPRTRRRSFPTC